VHILRRRQPHLGHLGSGKSRFVWEKIFREFIDVHWLIFWNDSENVSFLSLFDLIGGCFHLDPTPRPPGWHLPGIDRHSEDGREAAGLYDLHHWKLGIEKLRGPWGVGMGKDDIGLYWSIPDAWDEGPAIPAHFAWEPGYPKFNPLPLGASKMSFLFGALLFQLQNGRMGTKLFSVSSMLQFRQSSVGKVGGRYTEKFWANWRRIVSRFTEIANLSTFSTHCNWGVNTLCIFTCFPSQT